MPSSQPMPQAFGHALRPLERLKPERFELFLSRSSSLKIEAKDSKVDSLTQAEDFGLSIRLLRGKKVGFSYTTSLETSAIEKAVQSAWEIAEHMPEDPWAAPGDFSSQIEPMAERFDIAGLETPTEAKIKLALELEERCRRFDKRITGIRGASYSDAQGETHLLNHKGQLLSSRATRFSASITCKAEQNGDAQMGGDFDFSPTLKGLSVQTIAERGAKDALELLGAGKVDSLKCPTVIRNSVVAELLEFMSSSFSIEEMDKGRSLLQGKLGQKVFSPKISLIDDGRKMEGYSAKPFDAEGISTQKNILVDSGTLSGLLIDCLHAKKHGKKATGNAVRSIKTPPSIGTTNFYLEPAPGIQTAGDENTLSQKIKRGVILTQLMGVHTANPVTGSFSLGASGLLVENGKIIRPLSGFAVAGNILDVFKSIESVGSDFRFFGSVGAPSLLISEMAVSGS